MKQNTLCIKGITSIANDLSASFKDGNIKSAFDNVIPPSVCHCRSLDELGKEAYAAIKRHQRGDFDVIIKEAINLTISDSIKRQLDMSPDAFYEALSDEDSGSNTHSDFVYDVYEGNVCAFDLLMDNLTQNRFRELNILEGLPYPNYDAFASFWNIVTGEPNYKEFA